LKRYLINREYIYRRKETPMMKLYELLNSIDIVESQCEKDIEINGFAYHSGK
jgi:hypothetical protein